VKTIHGDDEQRLRLIPGIVSTRSVNFVAYYQEIFCEMMLAVVVLLSVSMVGSAKKADVAANSTLGMCDYSDTCSAGGYTGACVSISSGCCNGGGVTSGLCPGKLMFVSCESNFYFYKFLKYFSITLNVQVPTTSSAARPPAAPRPREAASACPPPSAPVPLWRGTAPALPTCSAA
jgi:hypothetical protein